MIKKIKLFFREAKGFDMPRYKRAWVRVFGETLIAIDPGKPGGDYTVILETVRYKWVIYVRNYREIKPE